jgi:hypothetical protein
VYEALVAPEIRDAPVVEAVVFEYHWYVIVAVPVAATDSAADEEFKHRF